MERVECPACGAVNEVAEIVRERRVGFCNACGVELTVARGEIGAGVGREMVVYQATPVVAPPPGGGIMERVIPKGVEIAVDHTNHRITWEQGAVAVGALAGGIAAGAAVGAAIGQTAVFVGLGVAAFFRLVATRKQTVKVVDGALQVNRKKSIPLDRFDAARPRAAGSRWLVDLEAGGQVVLTLGRPLTLDRASAEWLARRLTQLIQAGR